MKDKYNDTLEPSLCFKLTAKKNSSSEFTAPRSLSRNNHLPKITNLPSTIFPNPFSPISTRVLSKTKKGVRVKSDLEEVVAHCLFPLSSSKNPSMRGIRQQLKGKLSIPKSKNENYNVCRSFGMRADKFYPGKLLSPSSIKKKWFIRLKPRSNTKPNKNSIAVNTEAPLNKVNIKECFKIERRRYSNLLSIFNTFKCNSSLLKRKKRILIKLNKPTIECTTPNVNFGKHN